MTPKLQRLHDAAKNALGPWIVSLDERLGELTLVVKASDYREAARTLRDHPDLRFEQLVDLCGVDYSTYGDRPADGPSYAAVLHLLSYTHNWRLRLRCFCTDDSFPVLPSAFSLPRPCRAWRRTTPRPPPCPRRRCRNRRPNGSLLWQKTSGPSGGHSSARRFPVLPEVGRGPRSPLAPFAPTAISPLRPATPNKSAISSPTWRLSK